MVELLAGVHQAELLASRWPAPGRRCRRRAAAGGVHQAELPQAVQVVELLAGVHRVELLRSIAAELVAVVCVAPGRVHPCG